MKDAFIKIAKAIAGIMLVGFLINWGMKAQERKEEKYPWSVSYFVGGTLKDSKKSKFETLQECREWAQSKAEGQKLKEGEWDYECGRGCEYVDQSISGGRQVQTYECSEITK